MNVEKMKFSIKRRFSRLIGNSKGLTLVELLGVLAIMGLLVGITVPSVHGTIQTAKQNVCNVNASQLENMYESHLIVNDLEHSEVLFSTFINENNTNPDEQFQYLDGEVQCSIYPKTEEELEEEKGEESPYL